MFTWPWTMRQTSINGFRPETTRRISAERTSLPWCRWATHTITIWKSMLSRTVESNPEARPGLPAR